MKKISEIILGFMMGVITFDIIPYSIERIGVFPVLFCVLLSSFLCFFIKKIQEKTGCMLVLLSGIILVLYHIFSMPFHSYVANGFYSAIVSAILLSVQIYFLSLEPKENTSFKKSGIWYLSGLLLGILLK